MTTQSPLSWNKELLGDPPGSLMLKCPRCLRERNWYAAPFSPAEDMEAAMWRLQAAYRLRAGLKGSAFYAKRARQCREATGSEMPYWLSLQGSEMTLERPAPDPSSVEGLTAEDLPHTFPLQWLPVVDQLLLQHRKNELVAGLTQDNGS